MKQINREIAKSFLAESERDLAKIRNIKVENRVENLNLLHKIIRYQNEIIIGLQRIITHYINEKNP